MVVLSPKSQFHHQRSNRLVYAYARPPGNFLSNVQRRRYTFLREIGILELTGLCVNMSNTNCNRNEILVEVRNKRLSLLRVCMMSVNKVS